MTHIAYIYKYNDKYLFCWHTEYSFPHYDEIILAYEVKVFTEVRRMGTRVIVENIGKILINNTDLRFWTWYNSVAFERLEWKIYSREACRADVPAAIFEKI